MIDFKKNFEQYLNRYLDGELDNDTAREFEKFLEDNPDLAAELESYRSLDFAAKQESLPDLPEGYWEGLESRINKRIDKLPGKKAEGFGFWERFFGLNRIVKVAATVAALALVVLVSRHFMGEKRITEMIPKEEISILESQAEPENAMMAVTPDSESTEVGQIVDSNRAGFVEAQNRIEVPIEESDKIGKEQNRADSHKAVPALNDKLADEAITLGDQMITAHKDQLKLDEVQGIRTVTPEVLPSREIEPEPKDIAETVSLEPSSIMPESAKVHVKSDSPANSGKKELSAQIYDQESRIHLPDGNVANDTLKTASIPDTVRDLSESLTITAAQPQKSKSNERKGVPATTATPPYGNVKVAEDEMDTTLYYSDDLKKRRGRENLELVDFPFLAGGDYAFSSYHSSAMAPNYSTGSHGLSEQSQLSENDSAVLDTMRMQGDSIIQAYNTAINPQIKADILMEVIDQYFKVVELGKSTDDMNKCQGLLRIAAQIGLIDFPRFEILTDSLKMLIRQ